MRYLTVLLIILIASSGCSMLPQMQNWDTKDQILGGIFIAEVIWDAHETNTFIKRQGRAYDIQNHPDGSTTWKERARETNPFVKNKTSALVWGIAGTYFVLKGADILPEIRTGWLIGFDAIHWGGAGSRYRR